MIKTLKDLNQAGNRFWSRPNRDDAGKRAQDDGLSEEIKAFSLRNDLNEEAYQLIGEARGALAMGQRISARSRLDRAKAAQKSTKDFSNSPDFRGTPVTRIKGWQLVEGTGPDDGDWAAVSPGGKVNTFSTRGEAEKFIKAQDSAQDFSTTSAEIEAAAKKAKAAGKSKEEFVAGYSGGAAETAARVWAKDASGLAQEIKDILSKEGPMRLQGLRSELEANGWDVNQDNILMELRAIGAKQKYVQGLGNTWSIS